ncbi:DUF1236 domain-containing protein [Methylobacterium sp. NMS14P]|uniref:DUF1236 domain-containing protein n=1 Tax=Methylobacterium sp. NMS14P TaxID=2894310 RepID=UPI0023588839|nr:DUF1236 domain-containing protein [Methylobacterium sp. NMS14P]WCS26876.1 DUF1236 domain-containing protein [Methylobacterium sp. NMS14P]
MRIAASLALLATLAGPLAAPLGLAAGARAQGLERGAQEGASRGEEMAGPLGAIVGGAIGAAVGTANGILGVDRRERFRIYALGERRPSVALAGPVRVGTVLPEDGIVYYDVPREFALPDYSYTIVNDHPILVDPRSRRIVEVIE